MYSDNIDLNSSPCEEIFDNFVKQLSSKLDQNICDNIEKKSRGQGKNSNWIDARKGRITSSNFGLVCKKRKDTPPEGMMKTVMGYRDFKVPATEWGKKHEPAARRTYTRELKTTHNDHNVQVTIPGLVVNPQLPYLGCSPDGVVTCEQCSDKELLEIKCPFKYRNMSPTDAAKDPKFCSTIVNGKLKLKLDHNYHYQIQGQLGISRHSWCDFYIWTLEGTYIERIYFDEVFWSAMLQKLKQFYRQFIVPELFTNRVKRGKTLSINV